jgi:hypothetical protein
METILIILLSLLALITLLAALVFIRGLFPNRVDAVRSTLEDHWKRSFWLGLVNTFFITILVLGFASVGNNTPIFYLPAFVIYGIFQVGLLYGLSGFVQLLGDRLFPEQTPVRKDIRAGAVFLLTGLLPVIGWFLLFPYVICLSLGAVVLTLFQKKRAENRTEAGIE